MLKSAPLLLSLIFPIQSIAQTESSTTVKISNYQISYDLKFYHSLFIRFSKFSEIIDWEIAQLETEFSHLESTPLVQGIHLTVHSPRGNRILLSAKIGRPNNFIDIVEEKWILNEGEIQGLLTFANFIYQFSESKVEIRIPRLNSDGSIENNLYVLKSVIVGEELQMTFQKFRGAEKRFHASAIAKKINNLVTPIHLQAEFVAIIGTPKIRLEKINPP